MGQGMYRWLNQIELNQCLVWQYMQYFHMLPHQLIHWKLTDLMNHISKSRLLMCQ